MRTNNIITLNTILVNVYGFNDEIATEFPADDLFDDRNDFDYGPEQKAVAVWMSFTNERFFLNKDAAGVRRRVSVCLIDDTEHYVVTDTSVLVNIRRGFMSANVRVDLPLVYNDINMTHCYSIIVRDESSKKFIGEKQIRFFDRIRLGASPGKWYIPLEGGLKPNEYSSLYKQKYCVVDSFSYVSFLVQDNMTEQPFNAPEVEVRLTFGDGSQQRRFIVPEVEGEDFDHYRITMPFVINCENRGQCYAELICMDYPIAGFVFSTVGDSIEGSFKGKYLECIDDYDDKKGIKRLSDSFNEPKESEQSAVFSEDDLDRLIDEFIESQKTENVETPVIEDYDFDQTDDAGEIDENASYSDYVDTDNPSEDVVDFQQSLAGLTGLKAVKNKLAIYEKLVGFNKLRADKGLAVPSLPLHAMFMGSPGTGKTTVAKMMGAMLHSAGVLSSGHVVIKERSTLLGPNYSNEETNTLKAIEDAQGGILFIDEAYQLYQPDDPRDPGKFVIETLLNALADESKRDWMLILAGYPDEMRRMFDMNPGLKSRIPDSNIYIFEDFSEGELMEIAENYLQNNNFTLSEDAHAALASRLGADHRNRDKTFGNARYVMNLIQTEILPAMAVRVMSADEMPSISEICAVDIPAAISTMSKGRQRLGFTA